MAFIVNYILPFFYIALLAWLLCRDKKLAAGGLPSRFVLLFFVTKCLAGVFYSYVMLHFIPKGDDVAFLFGGGLDMYHSFLHHPIVFLGELKQTFTLTDIGLGHTDSDFIRTVFEALKFIHFICDLFSGGNLYTNAILFNGPVVWVMLRCWVFLKNYFGSWLPGAWLFLFPSAFFYTSAILKEGIEFALIAAILPVAYRLNKHGYFGNVLKFNILLALLFFFKFIIAITFLAALLFGMVLLKWPRHKKAILLSASIAGLFLFFAAGHWVPAFNMPQYIIHRQQEFLAMEANSIIPIPILEPSFISFCKAFPTAAINVLLRPLPGDGGKMLYYIYGIEIFCFWILVIYLWVKKMKNQSQSLNAFVVAFLLFAIINLLLIGYTIPNIGAITRYRSVFLPFLGLFFWQFCNGGLIFKAGIAKFKRKFPLFLPQ